MKKQWWKEAVVYQIYPRSFQDSNGDGVGDLPGILFRLDYLQELGINVIWICPFYRSPQDDNGYDISDYQDIQPEFGTMEDFERLLAGCRERGIKLIIDLVINHTSDEHPWFLESRSSRNSPKRDWYIWRDGKDGKEPNNWESIFGGSAWKYDGHTGQYFLHLFSAKQPDLNWENPEMREAVYKMIRWWLDKGIDGFRIDAITHMKKEPGFTDLPNPANLPYVPSFERHMNQEGILDYLDDICQNTFNRYDIVTVGEANGVSAEEAGAWVHESRCRLHMLIQFEHIGLWSQDPEKRIDLPKVKEVLTRWQNAMKEGGWNALYVENHDIPRIISKWGDSQRYWRESATSIACAYFLMRGTPFLYQGQEIGMTNTVFERPEDFDDVRARNQFLLQRREGKSDEEIIRELAPGSRDNARTPMQWDAGPNGGFTTGRPWLKANPNFPMINVESQRQDPDSVLGFYKKLIRLRKSHPVFLYGDYELYLPEHPQVLAYGRVLEGEKAVILANLSGKAADVPASLLEGTLVLANRNQSGPCLEPFECRVYRGRR